ncbi:MAG: hypothetical protein J3K34DRAFT_520690 [Monoraphidium minutum]|nr:MAG: hypothetical protein J3K34DRAFT_520690 [Monoraphidium minutum]
MWTGMPVYMCWLPDVDWSRYHLQVLIIDADDVLRSRLACGLFERVVEWNGYGRILLPWTCGVDADQGGACGSLSTQAALMSMARDLRLRPKSFTRPTERFEPADLDRHDVIVAVDRATKDAVLRLVDPKWAEWYDDRVRLLSEYASPGITPDAALLRPGGTALLPQDMRAALAAPRRPLAELRAAVDVPRPDMTDATAGGAAAWEAMVATTMLGVAGLARYLMDSYPPDLPDYDPL